MSSQDETGGDPAPAGRGEASPEAHGAMLQRAREQRGMSIRDMARRVTLSYEQIEQIENGGTDAFYSPGHKWLATRKYALALGIALEDEPALAREARPEAAAGGELWDFDSADLPVDHGPRTGMVVPGVALLIAVVVLAVSYSMLKQLESVLPLPASAQMPVPPVPHADAATAPDSSSAATASAPDVAAPPAECALEPEAAAARRWAPAQARRNDTRLLLTSAAEAEVCVIDADQSPIRLKLRPGITTIVEGKPPYLLHSPQLPQFRIIFQGLKVKVPAATEAMHLFKAPVAQNSSP